MVVLYIFWHLQNFESGNTFMKSKHRTSSFTRKYLIEIFREEKRKKIIKLDQNQIILKRFVQNSFLFSLHPYKKSRPMQEKFVTSGHDIRIASIKMNYIDKLQRDTQWVQILSGLAFRFFLTRLLLHEILCGQSFRIIFEG